MSMFPITAERGSFLPRQKSFTPLTLVEKQRKRSIKDILPKRSSFSRKGSKARISRTGSFALERSFSAIDPLTDPPVDGDVSNQDQSLFFSKLPFEIRLQIYEEVIGLTEIYHIRSAKGLVHFRCPRGPVNMARKAMYFECENGHPWTARPDNLDQRRTTPHPYATKSALLLTCRRAYLETFDTLYMRARFCFSGPETLLQLCKNVLTIRSNAGVERIQVLELRAPDLMTWRLRLDHPKANKAGLDDWMDCLLALKQMRSLRELYIILPNYGVRAKHSTAVERSFLEHFLKLQSIPMFVVWVVWYDDEGRGYERGDTEAERYPFDIVRYDPKDFWPEPFVESDRNGDGLAPWVDSGRL